METHETYSLAPTDVLTIYVLILRTTNLFFTNITPLRHRSTLTPLTTLTAQTTLTTLTTRTTRTTGIT